MARMDGPLLQARGLARRYGERVAVDDVSFAIAAGEAYGLLGPNGAGKTTTISIVAGVLAPHAGTVLVAGQPLATGPAPAKRLIGLVPQEIALYPDLSVRDNLRFFGRLQGLGGRRLAQRIDDVLEVVGLRERARERIEACSGGMRRRANIAVGLLHEPRLLILDEPTVGVDPQSRNQILGAIETLGGAGLAALYTTHYMEEAERLCDRIGILDEGRLVAEGTRRELVAQIGAQDRLILDVTGDAEALAAALHAVPGVAAAHAAGGRVEVLTASAREALAPVVAAASALGAAIGGIDVVEPDLEAVFLHLTGKALRDAPAA